MNNIKKLVAELKNGNQNSFNQLYKTTMQDVWYTCISLLKNEENAKDIMQNTYITAFQKIDTLEDNGNFCSWIKKIAVNKCKDFFKGKVEYQLDEEEYKEVEETDELMIPDKYISKDDKRKLILELMEENLSQLQYQAVLMHYFDDMTVSEIATNFECSEGTIMSRLNYSRKKMKKAITDYENKHNEKLHGTGLVPLFPALFEEEAKRTKVPDIKIDVDKIMNSQKAGKSISNEALKATKKAFTKTLKFKVLATACGIAVICGIATVGIALANNTVAPPIENNFIEETVPSDEVSAIKDVKLKVDDKGNVTDEKGNTYKADEDGKVVVKTSDGREVATDVSSIKAVNEGSNKVVRPVTNNSSSNSNNTSVGKPSVSGNTNNSGNTSSKPSGNTSKPTEKPTSGKTYHEAVYKTVHHDAEYKTVHHEAEYKTVHHEAEYKTVHHDAEYKTVHHDAVTHEEPVYETHYRLICNDCGADLTNLPSSDRRCHMGDHLDEGGYGSYTNTPKQIQVGTKTVTDKAAYDEKVKVKDAWDEKVKVKDAYDEKVLVKAAYDEKVKVKDAWDEKVLVKEAGWY